MNIVCVLKTGGDYTPDYVRRLRDGVARNITIPYRFLCLSDIEVPCERIPLRHGWKGWWSKIEVFREDVPTPALFMDLDTVIVDNLDAAATLPFDFSMMDVAEHKHHRCGNSGVMWLGKPQTHVYEKFLENPDGWIKFLAENAKDRYMGDQGFISECFEDIPRINDHLPKFVQSYKYHRCRGQWPKGCSIVAFGGHPRPHEVHKGWVTQHWI